MQLRRCALVVGLLLAGCGDDSEEAEDDGVGAVALIEAPRADPSADPSLAGSAITAFGSDLFGAVAAGADASDNVIVSPASVAIALAMLEPGATGDARSQLRDLLRIDDPNAFHASMNALEQDLEARVAESFDDEGDPGEVVVGIANAAYLQEGYPFEPAYLDAVGDAYGPVLEAVDFRPDPDAVAHEINRFVADATRDKIPELIADGVLSADTVLALVNALYLKASWQDIFDADRTEEGPFTLLDGSEVPVPMMHGFGSSSANGDGWVAATKPYVGGLAAQFILPDEGRFDDVAGDLAVVLADYDANATGGAELVVPRFEARVGTELSVALQSLGLTAPYEEGNLLGIADDDTLVVDKVIHETFVAMDEEGTEAAAATVISATDTAAPAAEPVPVILDRPFLFRILDQQTGATLFLGRVLNPT